MVEIYSDGLQNYTWGFSYRLYRKINEEGLDIDEIIEISQYKDKLKRSHDDITLTQMHI